MQPGRVERAVVGVVGRVGGVEDQAAQRTRVADRVGLAEQGPVGVAVEEDLAEAERPADDVEVLGGFAARVAGVARAELVGALADRDRFLDQALLQRRAVDHVGTAAAALVEDDEVAAAQQRRQGSDQRARERRRRRAVAGPAVHRHDRPQRGLVAIRAGADAEGDLGGAERWVGAAHRHDHVAAAEEPRHPEIAGMEAGPGGGIGRRRGSGDGSRRQNRGEPRQRHEYPAGKRPHRINLPDPGGAEGVG